ncbi:hypothetical protein EsH8_IX_000329 [Colletotrichum jinshuiense]
MSSSTSDQNFGKGARLKKGPFLPEDSADLDGDEIRGFKALKNATYDQMQDADIFTESMEDTINEMRSQTHEATKSMSFDPRRPKSVESEDLFVTSPGEKEDCSPLGNTLQVKSESDSDDDFDFMIIDKANAPPDVQKKWSIPRPPLTIDLTLEVKQEPKDDESNKSLGDGQPSASSDNIHSYTGQGTADAEQLEARKAELESKALKGSINKDDLQELLQLSLQLSGAKDIVSFGSAAPTNVDLQSGESDPKVEKPAKRKRRPPPKNAAEYFARKEQAERDAERRREARGSKRVAQEEESRKPKRTRVSAKQRKEEEHVDRRVADMLRPYDAIQDRADQGDLQAEPTISASKRADQLRQMAAAAPVDIDPHLFRDQKRELEESTYAWGDGGVHPKDGKWDIRGMLSPLWNHQIIVGAWMLGRELKFTEGLPRGGILADAMGMGKTIEALSCMVGNQSSEAAKDAGKGATLVLCQSEQMIDQWIEEIRKHCTKAFSRSVVHYKKGNKMDIDMLASFNVVVASYQQLRKGLPSPKMRARMLEQVSDHKKYQEWLDEQTGDLFRIEWYRVVLDEAHMIKNHRTHTAFACREVSAKYRWVMSGTPLINSATEFYSYLKFIRFDIDNFATYIRDYHSGPEAKKKRNRLVFGIMYRRTHSDKFFGQPILNLPSTHPTHQYLSLSKEEMVIYRTPNKRAVEVIASAEQKTLEEGNGFQESHHNTPEEHIAQNSEAGAAYMNAQSGGAQSPATNNNFVIDSDLDEVDSEDEVEEDADGMVPEEYLSETNADADYETKSTSYPRDESGIARLDPFGQSTFGLHFDMTKHLEYLERHELLEIAQCGICNHKPNCPFKGNADEDSGSDGTHHKGRKRAKDREYVFGYDYTGFQQYDDDKKGTRPIRFLQISDKNPQIPLPASAKLTALKETILRWQAEAPDDKIIIFSQFNVCMKIVGRMLEGEGIGFAYLSGAQNNEQRKKAVKEFEEGDTVRVLVASLRAGGQALNLTRGNRVALMELWWNHAVEQQAFARVFRMGQQKETHFVRFMVNTPIEKRMLKMQVKKILAIDAILQDDRPRAPKVSLEDIARLFGRVVRNDKGDMRVVSDYSDDEDDDEDMGLPRTGAEDESDLEGFVVPDDEIEEDDDDENDSLFDI